MLKKKTGAWTSSNADNDNQAVTIEVSNDEIGGNWHVSDKALKATIELCVDICKRNGIKKLNYTGDKSGNLTMHKWFSATNCLGSKFPYIAGEVNKRLNAGTTPTKPAEPSKPSSNGFLARVTADALNIRKGAGTNHPINGVIRDKGTYTIVETNGEGKIEVRNGLDSFGIYSKAEWQIQHPLLRHQRSSRLEAKSKSNQVQRLSQAVGLHLLFTRMFILLIS